MTFSLKIRYGRLGLLLGPPAAARTQTVRRSRGFWSRRRATSTVGERVVSSRQGTLPRRTARCSRSYRDTRVADMTRSRENIVYGLRCANRTASTIAKELAAILATTRWSGWRSLSGRNLRRPAAARGAGAGTDRRAETLLLDEPFQSHATARGAGFEIRRLPDAYRIPGLCNARPVGGDDDGRPACGLKPAGSIRLCTRRKLQRTQSEFVARSRRQQHLRGLEAEAISNSAARNPRWSARSSRRPGRSRRDPPADIYCPRTPPQSQQNGAAGPRQAPRVSGRQPRLPGGDLHAGNARRRRPDNS